MSIEVKCPGCSRVLSVKDEFAGKRGACPHCKQGIQVPAVAPAIEKDESEDGIDKKDFLQPTKKQLAYAEKLEIDVPDGIDRRDLSELISKTQGGSPPSEKQIEFLKTLGLDVPDGATKDSVSMILDHALDMEASIQEANMAKLEKQYKESGELLEFASDEQLLDCLQDRGREFLILLLDNDKYRDDEDRPMQGKLWWSYGFEEDAKYAMIRIAAAWSETFDMDEYIEECDGVPHAMELDEREFEGC